MIRESPVSGSWYRGKREDLETQILNLFTNSRYGPGNISHRSSINPLLGIISPHAGYRYSGYTAAHGYKMMKELTPELEVAIIIGPNHRGLGPDISISDASGWKTPFGVIDLDHDLIEALGNDPSNMVVLDNSAHVQEHSIEMQVPFLQYLYGEDLRIVPICLKDQSIKSCQRLGSLLADHLRSYKRDKYTIIASTDLSHEYSLTKLEHNDTQIIEAISSGDIDNFHRIRTNYNVTMCGYGSVYTLLHVAKSMGQAAEVGILNYTNSAQITGSPSGYTVGYLSASVS